MQLKQLAATCALLSATAMVQAKPIWQDFSVTGLYGENYEVVDAKETTITLEYAAKVKYADVFFFMDRMRGEDDHKSTYFELSPRLSLGEISGKNWLMAQLKMCSLVPLGKVIAKTATISITSYMVLLLI